MIHTTRFSRALFASCALMLSAAIAGAASITLVPNPLSVSAANSSGAPFTYTGSLNSTHSLSLVVTGTAALQAGPDYVTNAAGVVIKAGDKPGETVGSIADVPDSTTPGGALDPKITDIGCATPFPANAASGLGSSATPRTLVFSGTLASIFGKFAAINNPTLTFFVADDPVNYFDNSRSFTVRSDPAIIAPLPPAAWQSAVALICLAAFGARAKLIRTVPYGPFK